MSESPRNGNPLDLDTDTVKFIFDHVPEEIPEGWVLAHNRVYPQWDDQPPGLKGFLAWFHVKDALAQISSKAEARTPSAAPCDCGWSGLPHLRCVFGIDGCPPPNVRGNKMPTANTVERQDQQRRDAGARPKGSAVAGCRCCCMLRTTSGWARLAYPAARWPTLAGEAAWHEIAATIEPGGW